jgi:hypothetical protein
MDMKIGRRFYLLFSQDYINFQHLGQFLLSFSEDIIINSAWIGYNNAIAYQLRALK